MVGRRTILRHLTAGAASLLAGCSYGFGSTSDRVRFGVENADDVVHEVDVTLSLRGTVLVDHEAPLDPGATWGTTFENPAEPGDASLEARLANGASDSWSVRVGEGTGVHGIGVEVANDGRILLTGSRT